MIRISGNWQHEDLNNRCYWEDSALRGWKLPADVSNKAGGKSLFLLNIFFILCTAMSRDNWGCFRAPTCPPTLLLLLLRSDAHIAAQLVYPKIFDWQGWSPGGLARHPPHGDQPATPAKSNQSLSGTTTCWRGWRMSIQTGFFQLFMALLTSPTSASTANQSTLLW